MRRLFALVLCLALPLAAASPRNEASRLRNEAQLAPDDDAALNAYWSSLPKSGNYAVVEGDLLLTKEELRSWLRQDRTVRRLRPANGPELLLNLTGDGRDDYYDTMEKRLLTYTIDEATFAPAELQDVRSRLEAAAREWEEICPACGIDFVEKAAGPVWFTVQGVRNQPYIAAAFFPHYPEARRILRVDSSWFPIEPAELRTGVMRHELGHILGYRHEHIRNVPGCYQEGGQWKPLTTYDRHSVMHYFCGGGGNDVLALSDKEGPRMMHACDSESGSSGAPLFDAAGRVVAIHHHGFDRDAACNPLDKVNKAIRIDAILESIRLSDAALYAQLRR